MNYNGFDPNNGQNGQYDQNGQGNQGYQGYQYNNQPLWQMYAPNFDPYFYTRQKQQLGYSIASLISGVLSIILCFLSFISTILPTMAIALAIVARINNKRFDAMAIAGLVCGIVGYALSIFLMVFLFLLML